MIGIKGREMPKSCSECPFKANDYVCGLLDCAFSCNHFKERNYNCPLVEIITCKDCKSNKNNTCMMDGFGVADDYFCASAFWADTKGESNDKIS